jgi:hyperosmotically inducible protein
MNRTHRPLAPALSSLLLLLALAGCDRTDNTATGRAARRTPAATTTAAVPAATELEDAGQLSIDDVLIAAKVSTGLAADRNLSALKIKVASHAGVVTLRGPAPSAAAKARAEEIARNVQGVTSVDNQLAVLAMQAG